MGAHFEALDEGVLLVPLDPRYTQVGFNLMSVQVCHYITFLFFSSPFQSFEHVLIESLFYVQDGPILALGYAAFKTN